MGLQIYIHFKKQSGIKIDDIAALNAEMIADDGVSELYEEAVNDPDWEGVFKIEGGELLIARHDQDSPRGFQDYGDEYLEVWGCMDRDSFAPLAKHMTAGRLVVQQEIEGNDDDFFIVTPGKIEDFDF